MKAGRFVLASAGSDDASNRLRNFDYQRPGELYSRRNLATKPSGLAYRRFDTAAEAIRFAMEVLPSAALGGCIMESDGKRLGVQEVRALYLSGRYPLRRNEQRS